MSSSRITELNGRFSRRKRSTHYDLHSSSSSALEPCPRYAHQLVYDPTREIHYMFGGNPGRTSQPKMRLNDFWILKLTRPTKSEILKRCRYLLRRQNYREKAARDPLTALTYLQTDVAATVNHDNEKDEREFRYLASSLFGDASSIGAIDSDDDNCDNLTYSTSSHQTSSSSADDEIHIRRTSLFDSLVQYFPEEMTQPRGNLIDLIKL